MMRKVFVSQNQIIVSTGVHNLAKAKILFITSRGSMQCEGTSGNEKGEEMSCVYLKHQ